MKKLSALEENHVYCQICGAEMRKDTDQAPSTFSRQTGEEFVQRLMREFGHLTSICVGSEFTFVNFSLIPSGGTG